MPLTHEMRERMLRNDTVRAWISKRAYELHQLGGYEYGKATQDWVNAESDLLALASVLEEIFRSKAPQQALNERRKAKTSPKSQRRRTGSTSASPSEAPLITAQAKPDQESKKARKKR